MIKEVDETLSGSDQHLVPFKKRVDSMTAIGLMVWGGGWWYAGGLFQVESHISHQYELTSLVAFLVAFLVASAGLWLTLSKTTLAAVWLLSLVTAHSLMFILLANSIR